MIAQIDIVVASPLWDEAPDSKSVVHRAIAAADAAFESDGDARELSVLLCDDIEIRRLNRQWRGKDFATNVLSFPAAPGQVAGNHLGDIAIAYETVAHEARDEAKSFSDHLAHLAVHGYLHLVGYDHETDADAEEMEGLEREILLSLNVSDPYCDKADETQPSR